MLSRRNFLKGLLATTAAIAITKGSVLRPSGELETPTRTIFDMAQNTWREYQESYAEKVLSFEPCGYWPIWDGCLALVVAYDYALALDQILDYFTETERKRLLESRILRCLPDHRNANRPRQ